MTGIDAQPNAHPPDELAPLTRLYAMLTQINEAIVRIRDPQRLFQRACQIVVQQGGLAMAWIGMVQPDGTVRPMASAGRDENYLDGVAVRTDSSPQGAGPTGTCIRTGVAQVVAEIAADSRMAPWAPLAAEHGFRSCASFPLNAGRNIVGAIVLYAGEANFFSQQICDLLCTLADDVSFAIELMENERQRAIAEQERQRQTDRLDAINTVFREAIRCDSVTELAKTCLTVAEHLSGSQFGFIDTFDDDGHLRVLAFNDPGWSACKMDRPRAEKLLLEAPRSGLNNAVLTTGKSVLTNDPANDPRFCGLPKGHPPLRCYLGVPLIQGDRVLGLIGLANKPGGYDDADRQNIEALSVAIVEAVARKTAETSLRQLNEQLEARVAQRTEELDRARQRITNIFESISDAFMALDGDWKFTYVNPSAVRMLGYSADEMLGQGIWELFADAIGSEFYNQYHRAVREGAAVHFESYYPRHQAWYDVHAYPSADGGLSVFFTDRTEVHRAQQALAESQEQLTLAMRSADLGIWQWDVASNELQWTDATRRHFGVSMEEPLTYARFVEAVHPEDRDRIDAAVQSSLRNRTEYDVELRALWPDGQVRWLMAKGHGQYDSDGRPLRMLGITLDITARKKSEEALRRIEWLLTRRSEQAPQIKPPDYGDLSAHNRRRVLLDTLGSEVLTRIMRDSLDLLDTSAAVYERNGDYALGLYTSGWCRLLDQASRDLCDTDDDAAALACGKWVCHECCWHRASRVSIETGQPVDVECPGGLHIYAVPIWAGEQVEGSINIGYGDPPRDPATLAAIAEQYQVSAEELGRLARQYESRPPFMIELAKRRLETSAELIGALVEARQAVAESRRRAAEAEEGRRILDALMEHAPIGIAIADARENRLRVVSRAGCAMIGLTREQVENQPVDVNSECWQAFTSDGRKPLPPEQLPVLRAVRGEEVAGAEMVLGNDQGQRTPVLYSAGAIRDRDGQIVGGVVTWVDITERKRATDQIEALNVELQHRLAQLAASNAELEAFSYSVSHDLRGPLRGIDGFSQALLEDCGPQLGETGQQYLERIRSASQRMGQLIDDLLKLSRVSRAQMEISDVDLTRIAWEVVDELKLSQPQRNVEVTIEPDLHARGDARLLRVVMENLLGNAWKFTSRHARAHIEVGATAGGDGRREFFVRDDGAGFDSNYVNKLFAPFQRLHANHEFSGTGIGLATVQRIIRRHGGDVRAQGQVEQGATIFFSV